METRGSRHFSGGALAPIQAADAAFLVAPPLKETAMRPAMFPHLFAAATVLVLAAPQAFAGTAEPVKECPPDQRLTAARELTAPPDEGATREVLTYTDISGWRGVEGLALRIRRVTVKPGGYVPLHYHFDRPSVDYIIEGETRGAQHVLRGADHPQGRRLLEPLRRLSRPLVAEPDRP